MRIILHKFLSILRLIISNPKMIANIWRIMGVQIGEGTYVYRNVVISTSANDKVIIGKNCVLTGCTILSHDASTNRYLGIKYGEPSIAKPVIIEDDCFIGYGAIILMGVSIGKGSIVGSGSIVTRDVPPGSVVVGNPARVIMTTANLVEKRRKEMDQNKH